MNIKNKPKFLDSLKDMHPHAVVINGNSPLSSVMATCIFESLRFCVLSQSELEAIQLWNYSAKKRGMEPWLSTGILASWEVSNAQHQ